MVTCVLYLPGSPAVEGEEALAGADVLNPSPEGPAVYTPLQDGLPHTACPPLGWRYLNTPARSETLG